MVDLAGIEPATSSLRIIPPVSDAVARSESELHTTPVFMRVSIIFTSN